MADEFHKGDRVTWTSHGGTVQASPDEPQYLGRSDAGGEAVHEPSALQRA